VTIVRNGKPVQLSELRAGDRLDATIITTMPPKVVTEREVQAALAASGAPPAAARTPGAAPSAPPARTPGAAPSASPVGTTSPAAPTPAPAGEAAPRKLPKTAGSLPLMAIVGLTSLALGAALRARRRRSAL
jgi:LPXTG-motif cell wall-anchored protein